MNGSEIQKYTSSLEFFEDYYKWRRAITTKYPRVMIRKSLGVYRAYVGVLKVGVFGGLQGHGFILGNEFSTILYGTKPNKHIKEAA